MWEASVGEELYNANVRMAMVLIYLLWREPRFSSPGREGQLVIEDPVNRGHCQRDAVMQVQLRRAV